VDEDNSFITRLEVSRSGLLKSRPIPGADIATVFLSKRGKLYNLDRPLTSGEIAWDTPTLLFEVDTAVHVTTFELQLPAEEEAFNFGARVVAHWRIGDPEAAVKNKLSEPERLVKPSVEEQLREISRYYPIERSADAEREIKKHFASGPILLVQGVTLMRCMVSLRLDKSTIGHVASRTHAMRKRERLADDHQTSQLDIKHALEQASIKQQLEQQEATFSQLLAAQKEEHDLKLERMKMDFYSQALSEGNLNLIALRLSSNRDDVKDVINLFMRQRELDYEGARGMLNSLLENRLVNKRDVADIMARATSVVADHMTRAPLGMDWANEQPVALGGAAALAEVTAATSTPGKIASEQVIDEDDDDLDDDDDD
jgi:hypothetical protein